MTMNSWQLLLNAGVHPAVLARVCRWGRPHSDDLATEILYLAHTDAIKVHWGQHEDSASPSLAGLLPELIASTAFAANEAVSSDMAFTHALTVLIFPLNSLLALLGVPRISVPGVADPSTMTRSSVALFKRRS